MRDRGVFIVRPLCAEGLIRSDGESLLSWRGFGKRIGHISAENHKVLCGRDGIEYPRARLMDAIRIGVVQYMGLAAASRSVASASSLLPFVTNFHTVCPHQIENGLLLCNVLRGAEHALGLILVELLKFRLLPLVPVFSLEQLTSGEMHGQGDILEDVVVPVLHDPICFERTEV